MATSTNQIVMKHMQFNGQKVKRWINNGVLTYIAGSTVTYICNGSAYTEEVDSGADCLSPKTFTPAMAGATFKGWSNSPNSTQVLTSLTMGDEPITLYAVFKINDMSVPVNINLTATSQYTDGNKKTHYIVGGFDKSLYSGARLSLYSASASTDHRGTDVAAYFTDGTSVSEIVYGYTDWDDPAVQYPSARVNLNPSVNFTGNTGTVDLSIDIYSRSYGTSTIAETVRSYSITGGTLTLIGRTIVSSAVEEEPEPEPKAVLLTSDGYTLQDVNGVYLTTKEDE